MSLLGYLLQHCSPEHLNAALLHAFESLLRAVTPSEALTKQLLQQLLLNLRLWSSAPADGQLSLQALILKLAKVTNLATADAVIGVVSSHNLANSIEKIMMLCGMV